MSERELDPYIEWIATEARRPVRLGADARSRLLAAVRREPAPRRRGIALRWFVEPHSLRFSRLAGLAAAAGLVGVGVIGGLLLDRNNNRGPRVAGVPLSVDTASSQRPVDTVRVVKFVLVAPHASRVSLVGDFNRWDPASNPMSKTPTGGTWSITLPLTPGRHLYAFVLDGTQWLADPSAPLAPEDDFGVPNSVVLVGGSSS